jgi:hypothetical protein
LLTIACEPPRCEICGADAVATELRGGRKTPLCAVHIAQSDPEATPIYAEIANIRADKEE